MDQHAVKQARAELESRVQGCLAEGRLREAFELGAEGYGAEVLGYLHALLRDETLARDAFDALLEQVWLGLASFEGRSSFRTWMYALAFRQAARQRRTLRRRREQPLGSQHELPASERQSTALHRRTEARDWLARTRAELGASEQSLLILRIDRELGWDEIGAVVGVPAASLRKRFERIKARLRAAAARDGMLAP